MITIRYNTIPYQNTVLRCIFFGFKIPTIAIFNEKNHCVNDSHYKILVLFTSLSYNKFI